MKAYLTTVVQILAAMLLSADAQAQIAQESPARFMVKGGDHQLFARIFRSKEVTDSPVLVVVLHGDAPRNNPGYQYEVAAKIAATSPDVVVAALLRPGYTDPQGNHSEGERGLTVGDNWDAKHTDAIERGVPRRRAESGRTGQTHRTAGKGHEIFEETAVAGQVALLVKDEAK